MGLEKGIKHGKEHRKPYTGSRVFFRSCRNHGYCPWCMRNRLHKFRDKHPETMQEAIDDVVDIERNDDERKNEL